MHGSSFAWSKDAMCKGMAHLFYPNDNERPTARDKREARAKTLCVKCPVLEECRNYGRTNSEFGIWGGENEEDRFKAGYKLPRYTSFHTARRLQRQRKKQKELIEVENEFV